MGRYLARRKPEPIVCALRISSLASLSNLWAQSVMYPQLFEIGGVPIATFGVMYLLGTLAAIAMALKLARDTDISRAAVWKISTLILTGGVIGAKLLFVLVNMQEIALNPGAILNRSGWVYYGGVIGAALLVALLIRRDRSLSFKQAGDVFIPGITLAQSIGRLGCFSAGCDFGTPTSLPWGVTFTSSEAVAELPRNIPLHPTQLYSAVGIFVLFVVLLRLFRRRRFDGQVLCAYGIGYGLFRWVIEFLRGDTDRGFVLDGLLSTSQVISIVLIIAATAGYRVWSRQVSPLA